ncbi:MAG TPA: assimilatory sulfite reductase (NADPH) flavoprotein subunit [Crenotrichaceae bacterium]|nr:assimilatory sulfite reductase (NADPH) flavoprotein subunit [Crenotrichaceae bacterium]
MSETLLLVPVRTSRQGTSLNAGKLKEEYQDETSTVELHPDDITRLGLQKGDKIRMLSENSAEAVVTIKAQKGADAIPGLAFMAYGPVSSRFMEADTAGTGMPISKHMPITIEGPLSEDGTVMEVTASLVASDASLATSPLSPEQINLLNKLNATSLKTVQTVWLSGYFAAQSGAGLGSMEFGGTSAGADVSSLPRMTILFGSETGNSEELANELFEKAKANGCNVCLEDMMDYDTSKLENEELMFVIVSTQGEGDPPLTAGKLHGFFKNGEAPQLGNLKYSVLALGDSSYEFYCQTGKDFDGFLENLGATRVLDRVDADLDFEEPAEQWMEDVLEFYADVAEQAGGSVQAAGSTVSKDKSGFSKTNPYFASVSLNINLNGEGSAKETRHIEIELGDSGLSYEPGDALGVYPLNNIAYVEELLAALQMDGNQPVTVSKQTLPLRDAFLHKLDITALSRVNMEKYADLIGSDAIKTLLEKQHSKQFNEYTWGREMIDLVKDYPAGDISAQDFVNVLRKMPARLYSIASSLKAHPGQVHLLVGAVRYTAFEREREGVCSTFLAERIEENQQIAVYVHANKNFSLPDDPDTPIIMVGPGTGLAPFRAFLEERKATNASGENWLFFGDQHQASDFLYADELTKMHEDGLLTHLDLAFSRDQKDKIYVQTRIMEKAKTIYEWFEKGAYFYICGDAERMAHDVHKALIDTVVQEGDKTQHEAEAYIDGLLENRRYQRDVY